MNDEDKKYVILKFLDEEDKIMGLPIDEFIPILIIIITGFLCKFLLEAVLLAFLTMRFMRKIKRSKGKGFLFILAYWHGNEAVGKRLFPSFPKATERYFI